MFFPQLFIINHLQFFKDLFSTAITRSLEIIQLFNHICDMATLRQCRNNWILCSYYKLVFSISPSDSAGRYHVNPDILTKCVKWNSTFIPYLMGNINYFNPYKLYQNFMRHKPDCWIVYEEYMASKPVKDLILAKSQNFNLQLE